MERSVALKKLSKMLGKDFGYRVDPRAPTAEERAKMKAKLKALTSFRTSTEKAMLERKAAVLVADEQYQNLLTVYKQARDEANLAFSTQYHFKITVGKSDGMFFGIKAQGDSWEDVIRKLEANS